ncbi:hypothetical protein HOP50_08g53330 [Chloropicon primus]|uniref:Proteasome assembly chaperone 4 n=2 Tax=Chloropicon primus TaxID=1764295 RepID=A0A5B8MT21_9CHLO|nr:hypothetical protein A3770_08p53030 [Chloropicon primus]UPR02009.1 hypothetical protein HOP50_08g53330 [Chloropicon primus]|eukprot:QDZ22785.1 hypothetical protein A3770_08p53030 [Chloropicon primus]
MQEGEGREGIRSVEFVVALPEELGTARASVSMLLLEHQMFVWIGDKANPLLESMHFAIGSKGGRAGGGSESVTTLFGNRFNALGEKISMRLCKKLGIPVVSSWNVKTSFPQEELDVLTNLICKSITDKYMEQHQVS